MDVGANDIEMNAFGGIVQEFVRNHAVQKAQISKIYVAFKKKKKSIALNCIFP